MKSQWCSLQVLCLIAALALAPAAIAQRFITVASTTSTEQSGLFEHLLPVFEKKTGIQVRVVALIRTTSAPFVSRGDRSGTPIAELDLWKMAQIDIAKDKGPWDRETGQGMGPALNTASSMGAYTLSDRATWLAFRNRGDLAILVEGDKRLFNQYGVILVNPEKHPSVKRADGQAFIDWVISAEGQKTIADYKIAGEQLFFPNADDAGA